MSTLRERIELVRQAALDVETAPSPWKVFAPEVGPDWVIGGGTNTTVLVARCPDYGQQYLPEFIVAHQPSVVIAACDADLALLAHIHLNTRAIETAAHESLEARALANLEARYPA